MNVAALEPGHQREVGQGEGLRFRVPKEKVKPVLTGFSGGSRALGEIPPPTACSMSHIEKFEVTSKSSTPRRKVRRHIEGPSTSRRKVRCDVEKFDVTSNSSTPHRKVRCPASKRQIDAVLEYCSVRRFDGCFSPHARFRRLVSKRASAAGGGTSNLTPSPSQGPPRRGTWSSFGEAVGVPPEVCVASSDAI